ncbi:pyridoxamine 5'-phosphate oxidase [Pedobacter immunditicola]|uniref:pyridoxamine 5'-phosphate oxidase n=1 Tax=Pedobacter immunditicola TaxID=3133440 RepID=UPI0030A8FABB
MDLTIETLQNLRQDYRAAALTEQEVDKNPISQFATWFTDAMTAKIFEPNVMTLATADKSGRPSARIVLLKGFDEQGFTFYTNYNSHKGKELAENPYAALVFFWAELERQVRIEGSVTKIDPQTSDQYFHSRPMGSQIGAIVSPQSSIINSRDLLEVKVNQLTEEFKDKEIPRPAHWGGYIVKPTTIEFWQGRTSRLHDRINYQLIDGIWVVNRLAP